MFALARSFAAAWISWAIPCSTLSSCLLGTCRTTSLA